MLSPSTACFCLLLHLQALESRTQAGEAGEAEQVIWQLDDIEAGSRVDGLAVCCEDEVGRPAEAGVPGRIQVQPDRRALLRMVKHMSFSRMVCADDCLVLSLDLAVGLLVATRDPASFSTYGMPAELTSAVFHACG